MQEVEFSRETLTFAQMFLHMGVTNTWLYLPVASRGYSAKSNGRLRLTVNRRCTQTGRMLVGKLYYAAHHLGKRFHLL